MRAGQVIDHAPDLAAQVVSGELGSASHASAQRSNTDHHSDHHSPSSGVIRGNPRLLIPLETNIIGHLWTPCRHLGVKGSQVQILSARRL